MCEICRLICSEIKKTFGHVVDPVALQNLIEGSPLEGEEYAPHIIRHT